MSGSLAKHWFLILLLGGLGVALLWPDLLRGAVAHLQPQFIVAAALFLIAASLESRRLLDTATRPLPAGWAVLISYGAIPVAALLVGPWVPNPELRIGILITASLPCTLASAVLWTRMAGGNEATALLIVLLTTGFSWLITPAWLAGTTGTQVDFDTPAMMRSLAQVVIVPVVLGQLCRAVKPLLRLAVRYKTPLGVVSQLLIFSMILKAAVDVRVRLGDDRTQLSSAVLLQAILLAMGLHLTALIGGFWGGKALRLDRADQIAVAFGCSQKTLPVGLFLFDRYYSDSHPLAVVPLILYHVGQLLVDTFIARLLARSPAGSRDASLEAGV
jgi:sodium/bile acid cotransporter 7